MPRKISGARCLMFPTSPRSPEFITPYLEVLIKNFEGGLWNSENQAELYRLFIASGVMEGGESSLPDLSGREKITRSALPLGFVQLKPTIKLTSAGKMLLSRERVGELFLRQLVKFQYPSPYHVFDMEKSSCFNCKPFLEIMRLIDKMGKLTKDELILFGLQLTDYRKFDQVVSEVTKFREERPRTGYKEYFSNKHDEVVRSIYDEEIRNNNIRARENSEISLNRFCEVKKGNMRDYADACVRYLRYTGCFSLSSEGHNYSISIMEQHRNDVKYLLETVPREIEDYSDLDKFNEYLWDANKPVLFSDDISLLKHDIVRISQIDETELAGKGLSELKTIKDTLLAKNKKDKIEKTAIELKNYDGYEDILNTFKNIKKRGYYLNPPLQFEWNTWRAMTMMDGGNIKANLIFDDNGEPMTTAAGNQADIVCDYDTYNLSVEVTLSSGQRQFESEGEPVARHYGKLKENTGKETYCIFIAPIINDATVAHFYSLNIHPTRYYGGKTKIIPIGLDLFVKMFEKACTHRDEVNPQDIQSLLDNIIEDCTLADDEMDWGEKLNCRISSWLD